MIYIWVIWYIQIENPDPYLYRIFWWVWIHYRDLTRSIPESGPILHSLRLPQVPALYGFKNQYLRHTQVMLHKIALLLQIHVFENHILQYRFNKNFPPLNISHKKVALQRKCIKLHNMKSSLRHDLKEIINMSINVTWLNRLEPAMGLEPKRKRN